MTDIRASLMRGAARLTAAGIPTSRAEARLLLGMVGLWCALGLVVLGSASWWVAAREMGDPTYYLKRQAIWMVASWGLLYLGLRINLRRWLRMAGPALLVGMVLVGAALAVSRARST